MYFSFGAIAGWNPFELHTGIVFIDTPGLVEWSDDTVSWIFNGVRVIVVDCDCKSEHQTIVKDVVRIKKGVYCAHHDISLIESKQLDCLHASVEKHRGQQYYSA